MSATTTVSRFAVFVIPKSRTPAAEVAVQSALKWSSARPHRPENINSSQNQANQFRIRDHASRCAALIRSTIGEAKP